MIAFDHKLYSLGVSSKGGIALYKITVEDYYQSPKQPTNKRFHNLKYIEKVADIPADALSGKDLQRRLNNGKTSYSYSVADLYCLVKKYDREFFSAAAPNPAMLNEDGTPKILYHQTTEDFTVFDPKHPGAGQFDSELPAGVYMKETPDTLKLGKKYENSKQMALYAAIRNPLHARMRELLDRYMADSP